MAKQISVEALAKELRVCDRRFCVATSFNWLSFRGDPKRTFREELGFLVRSPQEIEESFQLLSNRFRAMTP